VTKTIIAIISDTHIGGTTALSLPTFTTDEGQEVKANKAQEWLYACWNDYTGYVKERVGTGKNKRRLVLVHLGDVVDGLHNQTPQALPNLADQEAMACEILRPLVAAADGGYYQIRGTEAHAGLAAQSEVRIAKELGAKACEYELDLSIDGVLLNLAHHGRAGARDWTSSAASVAAEVILDRAITGIQIPALIFRGHRHIVDDSGFKISGVRAISCPSWQLKTAFGYKVASGRRSDIGGLIVEDGVIDFSRARYAAAPGEVRRIIL
jgi:hypothetical protein